MQPGNNERRTTEKRRVKEKNTMPFKIVRNDITKMHTEAIVNTANDRPTVGTGCDYAVYTAAGFEELLAYRKEKIGFVKEGDRDGKKSVSGSGSLHRSELCP
jgi:hypothetical protein